MDSRHLRQRCWRNNPHYLLQSAVNEIIHLRPVLNYIHLTAEQVILLRIALMPKWSLLNLHMNERSLRRLFFVITRNLNFQWFRSQIFCLTRKISFIYRWYRKLVCSSRFLGTSNLIDLQGCDVKKERQILWTNAEGKLKFVAPSFRSTCLSKKWHFLIY